MSRLCGVWPGFETDVHMRLTPEVGRLENLRSASLP
jgi:hypothetical protein